MSSALNWFEIPVSDMPRAVKFYETILGVTLSAGPAMAGFTMAMFPVTDGVGGALLQGDGYRPSADGSLIYLACGPDLAVSLGRVEAAGGQVVVAKTGIGEDGFYAHFLDTEGNRVGLHSMG